LIDFLSLSFLDPDLNCFPLLGPDFDPFFIFASLLRVFSLTFQGHAIFKPHLQIFYVIFQVLDPDSVIPFFFKCF